MDCPSNLMNAIGLSKKRDCVSPHSIGGMNATLVADERGIAHKLFGAIHSPTDIKLRFIDIGVQNNPEYWQRGA
jgi:hypothetical protein